MPHFSLQGKKYRYRNAETGMLMSQEQAEALDESLWIRELVTDTEDQYEDLLRQVLLDIQETPDARVSAATITRINDILPPER